MGSCCHADKIVYSVKKALDARTMAIVLSSEISDVTPTVLITADSMHTEVNLLLGGKIPANMITDAF